MEAAYWAFKALQAAFYIAVIIWIRKEWNK